MFLAACVILAVINRYRQPAFDHCFQRMHQIGQVILLYENDHAGMYPNSLDDVLEEQSSI